MHIQPELQLPPSPSRTRWEAALSAAAAYDWHTLQSLSAPVSMRIVLLRSIAMGAECVCAAPRWVVERTTRELEAWDGTQDLAEYLASGRQRGKPRQHDHARLEQLFRAGAGAREVARMTGVSLSTCKRVKRSLARANKFPMKNNSNNHLEVLAAAS